LGLRDLGYTWKEIGRFLSMSESATKRMFHAELQQAMEIADHPQFRQAEVEVAKRRRHDRQQGPRVAPFTSPLCD
jgi:AraC-like DNA-binding protein